MRKLSRARRPTIIPIDQAGQRRMVRLEMGIHEARGCIYIKLSQDGRELDIGMTADQAEARAGDLMQFVYELRNGGKLG